MRLSHPAFCKCQYITMFLLRELFDNWSSSFCRVGPRPAPCDKQEFHLQAAYPRVLNLQHGQIWSNSKQWDQRIDLNLNRYKSRKNNIAVNEPDKQIGNDYLQLCEITVFRYRCNQHRKQNGNKATNMMPLSKFKILTRQYKPIRITLALI